MKLWKAITIALALAVGSTTVVIGVNQASADRQPAMRKALGHLEAAEAALKNATEDKGGHRVKALRLTREAIAEVKAGAEFDNEHDREGKKRRRK